MVIAIVREDLITEDVLPGTPTMMTYKTVSYTHLDVYKRQVMAFLGAMAASVVVYSLAYSRESRSINPTSLILAGTAIGAILSAITNLLIFAAQNKDSISSIYYWQMGSLSLIHI